MESKKLFILNIRMENQVKRLSFEGLASSESEEKFERMQEKIPCIGDESPSWEEFVSNVVSYYRDNGFMRIKR